MPPKQLVRVIHALIEGLVMQRILTPELCPDEVFYAAFPAIWRLFVRTFTSRERLLARRSHLVRP